MSSTMLTNYRPNVLAIISSSLLIILTADSARVADAAPVYWIASSGNFSGSYQDINHWSATQGGAAGEPVPDVDDTAFFDNNQPTAYEVDLNANATTGSLQVDTDKVTFDVNSSSLGLTSIRVGGAGETGVLTVTSSAPSLKGKITTTGGLVEIGSGTNANGTVIVNNGASFIRAGGGNAIIGAGTGSQATLHVINGTANLFGSSIDFGANGNGTVDVIVESAGTLVTNGFANFASTGSPDIDFTVDGGIWNHTHSGRAVSFGTSLTGQGAANISLEVKNGGTASNTHYYQYADGVPTRSLGKTVSILVTDTGSTMRSVRHYIGGGPTTAVESTHQVTVADNAILGVSQLLRIYEAVDTNSNSVFGAAGTLTLDDGIVELHGTPGTPAALEVRGVLRGNGTIRRRAGTGTDLVTTSVSSTGLLLPGDISTIPATGSMVFENSMVDIDGTVRMDIASESEYDQLIVAGAGGVLNFAGQLDISLLDGYKLPGGMPFNLMTAETLTFTGTWNLDPTIYSLRVIQDFNGTLDVLQLSALPAPEPGSLALVSCASLILLARRRRR